MNQITNPPNTYDFGHDFNYAVWTADTVLTLCNVPWNNDYRDIVKFEDRAALNAYIDGMASVNAKIENVSYTKATLPIKINLPFNAAYKFNYLRASNPLQPIPNDVQRDYYYFIVDCRYIAPNTTEIVVQLDVWQTFGFDVTFGNSYVERGHIGIANENSFNNYGRDYLTVPEGLDTGAEYQQIYNASADVIGGNNFPALLVIASGDLFADAGNVQDPQLPIAIPGQWGQISTGVGAWIFKNASYFQDFLEVLKDKPWMVNTIISTTMVPDPARYGIDNYHDITVNGVTLVDSVMDLNGLNGNDGVYYWNTVNKANRLLDSWRDSTDVVGKIPTRYRSLKKFLTYPYMIIEMTTWSGSPIVLKPELWHCDHADITERISYMPPTQRLMFIPNYYNSLNGGDTHSTLIADDNGEYLDTMAILSGFPTIPVANSNAVLFMAQNAHGLAFQNQSADWSQQKALMGASTAYGQATAGINASTAQTANANRTRNENTELNNNFAAAKAITNAVGGVVAGAAGGPFGISQGVGEIAGALNSAMDIAQNSLATNIANNSANRSQAIANRNAAYVRDTNNDLAQFSARGDYANTIAGIQAKVQDSRLVQPSVLGQFGGDAVNVLYQAFEVSLRWKIVDAANLRRIGEFWLRYGYAINQFAKMPESLMCMTNFTYWKLSETYITAAPMPETFKQTIRGIFEKGVTVWKSPEIIGTIDIADNEPLEGIAL